MPHSPALVVSRRQILTLAAAAPIAAAMSHRASADEPTAAQRMSEAGPQEDQLRKWTGQWNVTIADGTGRSWQFVRYEYQRSA